TGSAASDYTLTQPLTTANITPMPWTTYGATLNFVGPKFTTSSLANGGLQINQMFQIFTPATASVLPQFTLTSETNTVTGDIAFVATGNYYLDFQQSGTIGDNTFVLTESGTVTYTLTETGTFSGITDFSLAQTASLGWTWLESDSNGV